MTAGTTSGHHSAVIRNAVLHLLNEQPLVADIFERPSATDTGLICTNLRDLAGKRPLFADDMASIFFFPYHQMRFLEIRPGSEGADALGPGTGGRRQPTPDPVPEAEVEGDLEIDEDFLRRIREV